MLWITFIFLCLCLCMLQHGKAQENAAYADMQQLTQFRRQHRKTIDGRLCAAAFVQDGVTYTDCTDTKAPDGTTGREWCFIEVQELGKGPRDWEFCNPPLVYDKIRAKIREAFEMKSAENEKMIERLNGEVQRLQYMKNRYNSTCGIMHEGTGERLAKIEELVVRSQQCLKKTAEITGKIGLLKSSIDQIHDDMRKAQHTLMQKPEYCAIVPGYEDDPLPDGLRGAYYSNPIFHGAPRAFRNDRAINFFFNGKGPIEGVTAHKFSIRWDGYLLAPHSGSFIFSTETTCGARFFLSGKAVVVDRMPQPATLDESDEDHAVPIIPASTASGLHKVSSAPQHLIGGKKYKIRLEMIHSGHLKYTAPTTAVIKLLWKSGNVAEQVIPSNYFFKSNPIYPIKISGLDSNYFDISLLYNGENAFKDDSSYVLGDVPPHYERQRMIRRVKKLDIKRFKFSVNVPAIVYVASPMNQDFPLASCEENPWKARDTTNIISVYHKVLGASVTSAEYKVAFIELREGGDISFQVVHDNDFFFFVEPKKESESTCGGEEQVLSLTDGPYFQGCTASSQMSEEFDCRAGLSGKHMDERHGVWRTSSGNGVGEYIVVRFKQDVQLTQFRFKPRDDAVYSPNEISLTFAEEGSDDEQVFSVMHVNNLMHNTYDLYKPVITKYVKAEITRMNINGEDTGGSFEFIGTSCNLPEKLTSSKIQYQDVKIPECFASIENLPEVLPIEDGQQFIALCRPDCLRAPEGVLHGVDVYSTDSSICLASLHAGLCKKFGTACRILVTVGGRKDYFDGSNRNGITSTTAAGSDASITLSAAPKKSTEHEKIIKYAISFQSNRNAVLPDEYLVDNGQLKAERNGVFYGWLRPARLPKCPINIKSNVLNNGGVSFPPSTASEECLRGHKCEANFWSITLPKNGRYLVEVQVGSPCEPLKGTRAYFLQVNGVPVVSGKNLAKGQFYWAIQEVQVLDKMLVLTSECKPSSIHEHLCDNAVTTLMNLKIKNVDK